MTRTPKEAFLKSEHRQKHEEMVLTASFQTACEYALLELAQSQPEATDPSKGWDAHSQMVGARKVLEILKALHEPVKEQKPLQSQSLKYNV